MNGECLRVVQNLDGQTLPEKGLIFSGRQRSAGPDTLSREIGGMRLIACDYFAAWPDVERWSSVLPHWFLSECSSPADDSEDSEAWDLESWLYAMEDRSWTWWSSMQGRAEWEI